jgi:ribosomal protein S18 acetylase RimI-like enzyme
MKLTELIYGIIDEHMNEGFVTVPITNDFEKSIYQDRKEIIINGNKYFFNRLNTHNEKNVFTIELSNGEEIGRATLNENGLYLENIRIDDKYRRIGLASKLYEYIEELIGKKLIPSPIKQSPEIQKYWDKKINNINK